MDVGGGGGWSFIDSISDSGSLFVACREAVVSGRVAGWVTGVGVVLGGAQALAINKVDAGPGWRIAAVVCTVLAAVLAGWLAWRVQRQPVVSARERHRVMQGPGSALISGKVTGSVRTRVDGVPADAAAPAVTGAAGDVLGAGAVRVDRSGEVGLNISTHVTGPDGPSSAS